MLNLFQRFADNFDQKNLQNINKQNSLQLCCVAVALTLTWFLYTFVHVVFTEKFAICLPNPKSFFFLANPCQKLSSQESHFLYYTASIL